jgi:hypothetical protein
VEVRKQRGCSGFLPISVPAYLAIREWLMLARAVTNSPFVDYWNGIVARDGSKEAYYSGILLISRHLLSRVRRRGE